MPQRTSATHHLRQGGSGSRRDAGCAADRVAPPCVVAPRRLRLKPGARKSNDDNSNAKQKTNDDNNNDQENTPMIIIMSRRRVMSIITIITLMIQMMMISRRRRRNTRKRRRKHEDRFALPRAAEFEIAAPAPGRGCALQCCPRARRRLHACWPLHGRPCRQGAEDGTSLISAQRSTRPEASRNSPQEPFQH